ncbi:hypothetical protein [Rhodovulum sp. DZ06]|uniref:hypothetical protein n=1 Tax=Rhodovulum sp. DZ06 TaxID=3425126 RepID=UPI003D3293B3
MNDTLPPPVHCLWISGALSFLELLCLASMRDAGHAVTLWSYEDIPNRPDFCAPRDAAEVLPAARMLVHDRTGSPAPQSDKFRFRMLAAHPGVVWADTDAYVLRPLRPTAGRLYGWESASRVNSGVIALPPDSPTLAALIAFTDDPAPIPPWFPEEEQAALRAARDAGRPVPAEALSWGLWGPQATTHFLRETGEIAHALPTEALYPVPFKDRRVMLKAARKTEALLTERTMSVHLYGRRMRARLREKEGGVPPKGSWLAGAMEKHGIRAEDAPLAPARGAAA